MRPGNQNKQRMRGRGRKGPNPLSRTYESNGPDVKIRGTALHIAEKYQQLARDAQAAGDRVMSENYNQHAEHYLRIVAAAQPQTQQVSPRQEEADDETDQANERRDGRDGGGSRPYMPLDAPQPFIDRSPGINTKGLREGGEGESTESEDTRAKSEETAGSRGESTSDSGDTESSAKRRTRGTRGRGVRRSKPDGAGEAASENSESSSEPDTAAGGNLNGQAAHGESPSTDEGTDGETQEAPKKARARRAPRARAAKKDATDSDANTSAPTEA